MRLGARGRQRDFSRLGGARPPRLGRNAPRHRAGVGRGCWQEDPHARGTFRTSRCLGLEWRSARVRKQGPAHFAEGHPHAAVDYSEEVERSPARSVRSEMVTRQSAPRFWRQRQQAVRVGSALGSAAANIYRASSRRERYHFRLFADLRGVAFVAVVT